MAQVSAAPMQHRGGVPEETLVEEVKVHGHATPLVILKVLLSLSCLLRLRIYDCAANTKLLGERYGAAIAEPPRLFPPAGERKKVHP